MRRVGLVVGSLFMTMAAGAAVWWAAFRIPRLEPEAVLAVYRQDAGYPPIVVNDPPDQAVFPPEIAPPTFRWQDRRSHAWLVTVALDGGKRVYADCRLPQWTPKPDQWSEIQAASLEKTANVTVLGVDRRAPQRILAAGHVAFGTSKDEVGAPIFYREVILPFEEAVRDPSRIRWRFGSIDAAEQPPIVLENLPVCGNCHSFSSDGSVLGMDVDYANDHGSYAIAPVEKQMALDSRKIITWNDYRRDDGVPTFGLLSQVSPDGRYVVSTVKDRSVFLARPDLAFSQLFFPIRGILVVYDRQTGEFRSLSGADDPQYVQSNPAWSPDGRSIVFARAPAYHLEADDGREVLLTQAQCQVFLDGGKRFQYDLYRIPFDGGLGGDPEPLLGASHNGMSNYFPKFSPDGKWIVFCKAKSFMLLQPDSQLYIVPAAGGEARRLACNTGRMNSWHSWSPNSRWLVFSSKANSPYTQLFLTHIDALGQSTPPILLDRFTSPDRAANIPEFVQAAAGSIARINERFIDDHSFARIAGEAIHQGDLDRAEEACRRALAINPASADALCNLGAVMARRGQTDEATRLFRQAIRSDPKLARAYDNLGTLAAGRQQYREAVEHYRKAVKLDPQFFPTRLNLGILLLTRLNQPAEALPHLSQAARLLPTDASAQSYLAVALERENRPAEAADHFRVALRHQPDHLMAMQGLAYLLATAKSDLRSPKEAILLAKEACRLTNDQNAESLEILAVAHAAAGQYDAAVQSAARALEILHAAGDDSRAQKLVRRLRQYDLQRQAAMSTP